MIYVVRHGETDWNKEGRYQGRIDVELNEVGVKQAELLHNELKSIKFDVVFSSPLKRAYKTASLITNNNIIVDKRLIERGNGKLEGKLKKEVEKIEYNDLNCKGYGIENIVDFKKRINDFLDEIILKYKNKNVLIVTHAGVSIYIRCYFDGDPKGNDYDKLKLKNCEIIQYDN